MSEILSTMEDTFDGIGETVKETFGTIKKTVGGKGFLILIVGAGAFGLYHYLKDRNVAGMEVKAVTGVTSYPDVVTNADVVISTLQNSLEYTQTELEDALAGFGSEMQEYLGENFQATNDYINEGLSSQEKLLQESMDSMQGSISSMQSSISSSVSSLNNAINQMKTPTTNTSTKATTTTTKTSTSSTSKTSTSSSQKLNVNTSIVDALKSVGIDSSMANRTQIAKANGISNYTGTYEQNVALLNKFKSGTLKTSTGGGGGGGKPYTMTQLK